MAFEPIPVELFFESFSGEDELGVVIRAHLHVESLVHQYIAAKVFDVKPLKKLRLDFDIWVDIACALGLPSEVAPGVKSLGGLRNKFAHRPGQVLTRESVGALYETLSPRSKAAAQHSYKNLVDRAEDKRPSFREVDPKTKFCLIAISVYANLLIELEQNGNAQPEAMAVFGGAQQGNVEGGAAP